MCEFKVGDEVKLKEPWAVYRQGGRRVVTGVTPGGLVSYELLNESGAVVKYCHADAVSLVLVKRAEAPSAPFKVGDKIVWKGGCDGHGHVRVVTEVTDTHLRYARYVPVYGTFADGVSLEYAVKSFRVVKRTEAPHVPPESFRAVFCAWTGQPPKPEPTRLEKARQALYDAVQRPELLTGHATRDLVDEIVAAAKDEARRER